LKGKETEMKRFVIIATLIALAQMASGFSPMPQTFPGENTLRRIDVNAKTITALAPGKNYIVDLTQRGVIYEFSPQAGQIDFSRVRVRTAQGEVAIGSFLETTYLKDKLAGFKYASQAFSLETLPSGTLQNPPSGTSNSAGCHADISAGTICSCSGVVDCKYLKAKICASPILCATNPITGEKFCSCKGQ
jgi:hypothetical protein